MQSVDLVFTTSKVSREILSLVMSARAKHSNLQDDPSRLGRNNLRTPGSCQSLLGSRACLLKNYCRFFIFLNSCKKIPKNTLSSRACFPGSQASSLGSRLSSFGSRSFFLSSRQSFSGSRAYSLGSCQFFLFVRGQFFGDLDCFLSIRDCFLKDYLNSLFYQ